MTTRREKWAKKYYLVTRDDRGRFITTSKWSPVRVKGSTRIGRAWKYEILVDAKGTKTGSSLARVRTVHYFTRKPLVAHIRVLKNRAISRLLRNARVRRAKLRGNVRIHESEEFREIDADEIEENHDEEFESKYKI